MTPISTDAPSMAPRTTDLTPRQRLESALSHLPVPTGSLVIQKQTDNDLAPETRYSELLEPVQRINEVMRSYGVEFKLQDFSQGQRVVTQIIDRDSGEMIRQIPSEEVLRIAESLDRMQGRLIQLEA